MKSSSFVLLAAVIAATPASADFRPRDSGFYLHRVGIKMEMVQPKKPAAPAVLSRKANSEAGPLSPAVERINPNPYGQDLTTLNGYGTAYRKGSRGADWRVAPVSAP